MIDEASHKATTPTTREQQRQNTRRSILEETVACLVEDGYGSLTTRRIAERVGIAQSTLMHHFATREALLVEAVSNLAVSMAETAVAEIGSAGRQGVDHREAVLDQAWTTLTTPEALAAAQLLGAAWSEPELAVALRDLELRIAEIVLTTALAVFPQEATDPRFATYIDSVFQTIRGLIMSIPTWGREAVDLRWSLIKPVMLEASGLLIPPAGD
ncbi:MAG: TetR/AcrR family transcriptional regulator [Solirubrobacteraceae bacterium]|nr:TetR/AcrR family transcriptional regulator [Solirubrobacteraceae bacterium]